MREIVMDTETTGLDPNRGDRLVEIACVELHNYMPSGRVWHEYINPERDVPKEAFAVHGLSTQFLSTKPLFSAVVEDFLRFTEDATLIFHNAPFDMGFINMELTRMGLDIIPNERVVDTLAMARRKHPAGPNSLDALCKRYGVDNSGRTKHGALLDAELLADVYLHLVGGQQPGLDLSHQSAGAKKAKNATNRVRTRPQPLALITDPDEQAAHEKFVSSLQDPVWNLYSGKTTES
ncbi:MAG: DNA polymerase III subunit epsilon [Alphaproteobacteria bacterium]